MKKLWSWSRNKFGRIVSGLGMLLQGSDMDISPIKSSLEAILSHRAVEAIVVGLFLASWARHQQIASRHP